MSRRSTALLVAALAVAMVVVGQVVAAVDDGGTSAAPAPGAACITDAPLVVVGGDGNELTVVQPDGTQSTITGPEDGIGDPDVTPDRTSLVATVTGAGSSTVWTMALDGSSARPLTEPDDDVFDTAPTVSPDGSRVAFVRDGAAISTVPLGDGEGAVLVAAAEDVVVAGPEWSPSGERLAYLRTAAGGPTEIWTVAADGTDARPEAPAPAAEAATLDWSPDGTQLLGGSTGDPDGPWEVAIIDIRTKRVRPLDGVGVRGRWSRGGTQVVRLATPDGRTGRLEERGVPTVDGADVSSGAARDLGVTLPLGPEVDLAVAPCLP